MPRHELENNNRADAGNPAALAQRRDGMVAALQDTATRNAAEQQRLQNAQGDFLRNNADDRDGKLAPVLAEQRSRLEAIQNTRVDLINKALDASSRVENNGAEGSRPALQILNMAAELNRSITETGRALQENEASQMKQILSTTDAAQRDARIGELIASQARERAVLDRDGNVASAAISRNEALAMNALDKSASERLRASMTEAVNSEKLRGLLSNDVLQRLANEALVPGREKLQQIDEGAAIQRVKGELAEQIAATRINDEVKQENLSRAEQQKLYFVAGDRVRDDMGKLADGLIAFRDQEDKVRIWAAIEVKSGPEAARELNNEKVNGNGRAAQAAEKRNYQRDAGSDANLVNSGQLNQTAERLRMALLDEGGRLYIDNRAIDARMDRDRQWQQDFVRAYVTDDAIQSDKEVRRLGVNSQDLEALAKAFVEELLRQRETV